MAVDFGKLFRNIEMFLGMVCHRLENVRKFVESWRLSPRA